MRRIKPNTFKRIVKGWTVGISTIVGLTGIISFVLTLVLEDKIDLVLIIIIAIVVLVAGIIAAFVRGKQKLIPDIILDELSSENRYVVNFCTRETLREADEMTKPYFGRNFIPFDKIEQWRMRNNNGFVNLINSEGALCACFVIIGLENSFFDQFIAGRVTEHEIDSDVVLSFEEMKRQNRIYISGVVVRNPGHYKGAKRTRAMLWTMLDYIRRVFTLRETREFYAVGLTAESEKLLTAIGFKIHSNKKSRKDQCNLYKIDLDKNTWLRLMSRIGNFSKMVNINYTI